MTNDQGLILALDTVAVGLAVLRARTPGTPPGDADDQHEDNTFALPNGNPIRRSFKRFARRQLKKILGTVPAIGAPLPASFPPIAPDWTDPMASAMTPLISAYWDEAGKTTRARLGLDPDAWEVHDPHLHQMIRSSTLKFCKSTNETTDLQLADALDRLKGELAAGLVEHGESIPELAARVRSVFGRLSGYRAEMIARTEASRAVHAASQESARESGVVQGKRWLTSANSCDRCVDVARQVNESHPRGLPLDQPFASERSKQEEYASVPHPPLHPHCRCSITFVLTDEYEDLLKQHPPGGDFEPGPMGPEPKKREVAKPAAGPKPRPARPPRPRRKPIIKPAPSPAWQPGDPIEPTLPIQDRIPKAGPAQAKLKAIRAMGTEVAAIEAERQAVMDEVKRIAREGLDAGKDFPTEVAPLTKDLTAQYDELTRKVRAAKDKDRDATRKVLELPESARADWRMKDGAGDWGVQGHNGLWRQLTGDWMASKVARGSLGSPIQITWEAKAGRRAGAVEALSLIKVKVGESPATMIHEMGHHVEYRMPGAQAAAREFLAYRIQGQAPQRFQKVFPGHGYRADEKGCDDQFGRAFGKADAWYVGKIYDHGSTEILSMGIEKLYNDPVGFAKDDPEYCAFVIGILDGSLRKP